MRPVLALLALACSAPADPKPADDAGAPVDEVVPPADGPYLGEADGFEAPDFDLDALGAGVADLLVGAPALHGGPVIRALDALMVDQGDGCPTWAIDESGNPYWSSACTTPAGTRYDGYGLFLLYDNTEQDGVIWTGTLLYAAMEVSSPEGTQLRANGGAGQLHGISTDGSEVYYALLDGEFAYNGPEAAGTFLEEADVQPALAVWATRSPGSPDGGAVNLSGRLAREGGAVRAVAFNDTLWIGEGWGGSCPDEPAGSLSVLTSEGVWLEVAFDGPTWDSGPTPAGACDGCGRASYRGADVGALCVDFSAVSALEVWPW